MKTGQMNLDHLTGHFLFVGTSVDAFVGRFMSAFVGVLKGLNTKKSTLVGLVVGAIVGDLVGALVGPLVGTLVVPLVDPLVGQSSLSPALCVAHSCMNLEDLGGLLTEDLGKKDPCNFKTEMFVSKVGNLCLCISCRASEPKRQKH